MNHRKKTDSISDVLPVDRLRLPIHNFIETEKFKDIFQSVSEKDVAILHCHGVPGSGKSEITRKLAELFPFTKQQLQDVYIKWHIQCKDSGHDVKTELKTLVEQIGCHNLLPAKMKYQVQAIQKNITENYTTQLTHTLLSTKVPVLIIIEDINPEEKDFLKDFFRSINKIDSKSVTNKFHIYITSRSKSVILRESEWSEMKNYHVQTIQGFEKDEGVAFLMQGHKFDEDTSSAEKVCDMFSGSPLALCAAKTYCQEIDICYSEYLLWLEEWTIEDDIDEDDKSVYGNSALCVFQAIAGPFHVKNDSDCDATLMWKVLSCLTHLHYDRIPFNAIQQCCYVLDKTDTKRKLLSSKIQAGKIIRKLHDHGMCTETEEKDVTFHEVVMRAFRHDHLKDSAAERLFSLKATVYVIARIITKDIREKKDHRFMELLIRHVQSLLQHVENDKNILIAADSKLLGLLISYMYECLGAIVSSRAPQFRAESNCYFEKAFKLLWNGDSQYSISNFKEKGDVKTIAEHVVKVCKLVGDSLPPGLVGEYESKLSIMFDSAVKAEFERKMKQKQSDFVFGKAITNWTSLQLIEALRDCGLFLDETSHRRVFFAERLAAILHSWSRWILYIDNPKPEQYNQYIRFSELSQAISVECRKKYDVCLLTEHISVTSGMISLILKVKAEQDKLLEAKAKCESVLSANISKHYFVYEHGLQKIIDGTNDLFLQIQMHRNLVRIYMRLVVKPDGAKYIEAGNERCAALLGMIKSDHTLANTSMCFIYCAKYYAASRDLDKSINCFHLYFKDPDSNPPVHAWAIYNYCRAVLLGSLSNEKEMAIHKCQKVLASAGMIPDDLNDKLISCLDRLRTL